eukprot:c8084_g1_i1.p1 GENE.c8084_g1_i1~~c8084_g1_i1.p1  ORF type:complete len:346 (+),score=37.73 c8084_g1_i1:37-1074(+)
MSLTTIACKTTSGIWQSDDCPSPALCIPQDGDKGFCSCEYITDLYRNVNPNSTACEVQSATYGVAAAWGILLAIAFVNACVVLFSCWRFRLEIVKCDTLAITQSLITFASISMCTHFVSRISNTLQPDHEIYQAVGTFLIASQAIYAFFVTFANVFFGLSLYFMAQRISQMTAGSSKTKSIVMSLALGIAVLLVQIFTSLARQNAVNNIICASIALASWVVLRRAQLKLMDAANGAMLVGRTLELMTQMRASSRLTIATIFALLFGAVIYSIVWYTGLSKRDQTLLGPCCLTFVLFQHVAVMFNVIGMGHYLRVMIRFRFMPSKSTDASVHGSLAIYSLKSTTTQ